MQNHGEISKQERKAWNRHVRERNIRRQETPQQAGLAAGMLFMLALALAMIDLYSVAGWVFVASIFFAFISWITGKLYGKQKEQH